LRSGLRWRWTRGGNSLACRLGCVSGMFGCYGGKGGWLLGVVPRKPDSMANSIWLRIEGRRSTPLERWVSFAEMGPRGTIRTSV